MHKSVISASVGCDRQTKGLGRPVVQQVARSSWLTAALFLGLRQD